MANYILICFVIDCVSMLEESIQLRNFMRFLVSMSRLNILVKCVFLVACFASFGQTAKLRAYLDCKHYFAPGTGSYVEIITQYSAPTVQYIGSGNGLQAEIAVSFKVLHNQQVVAQDAYRLKSPLMKDSIVEDFYDVKRFALSPGKYDLEIEMRDLNTDLPAVNAVQPLEIKNQAQTVAFSDIQAIEYATKGGEDSPFYKSGYTIIPRITSYYSQEINTLPVYFEIYNTVSLAESECGLRQVIYDEDRGVELSELTVFSRHKTSDVIPIIRKIDLANLPTGSYRLNFTVLSRDLKELSQQNYFFERSNDIQADINPETIILDPSFQASITDDSVSYYLESLIPISKPAEIKKIITSLKTNDLEKQRKHIQAFWAISKPVNPYESWMNYKTQVQLVKQLYANNFQEGFETDRGRVYLQYGSPTNIIVRETSPSEYPYEIWQYNKIGKFSNKRFIFYNPDLVNNAYRLLHSDMLGELKNPGWQQVLSKRNTTNGNVDDPNSGVKDHFGGDSKDLFRQY